MKPFLTLLLLLAGCAQIPAPQTAMRQLNISYQGHDANSFFTKFGMAFSSQTTAGGATYRWLSLEPQTSRTSETLTYPGGHLAAAGANGEMISGYCEIRIQTDWRNMIQRISLIYDSAGKFSGSRCAEIFAMPSD